MSKKEKSNEKTKRKKTQKYLHKLREGKKAMLTHTNSFTADLCLCNYNNLGCAKVKKCKKEKHTPIAKPCSTGY